MGRDSHLVSLPVGLRHGNNQEKTSAVPYSSSTSGPRFLSPSSTHGALALNARRNPPMRRRRALGAAIPKARRNSPAWRRQRTLGEVAVWTGRAREVVQGEVCVDLVRERRRRRWSRDLLRRCLAGLGRDREGRWSGGLHLAASVRGMVCPRHLTIERARMVCPGRTNCNIIV